MPCLLLLGATGIGKTKIIRKLVRDHPSRFEVGTGITTAPVVTMQMPPEPDEKSFYVELLSALQAPVKHGHTVGQLRRSCRGLMSFMGEMPGDNQMRSNPPRRFAGFTGSILPLHVYQGNVDSLTRVVQDTGQVPGR